MSCGYDMSEFYASVVKCAGTQNIDVIIDASNVNIVTKTSMLLFGSLCCYKSRNGIVISWLFAKIIKSNLYDIFYLN